MPLDLYRRHSETCTGKYHLKPNPQEYTKCACPVYCYGFIDSVEVRRSMKTRDWGRAQRLLPIIEQSIVTPVSEAARPRTLAEARDIFLAECATRKLAERTILNYRGVLKNLLQGFDPLQPVSVLTFDSLTLYRQQLVRPDGQCLSSRGSLKVLKILRLFCGFAVDHGWLVTNPAKKLKPPKDDGNFTRPFEPHEVTAILDATHSPRERALILTLLYTGLRISDAYMLRRTEVDFSTGALIRVIQKTRTRKYTLLHPGLLNALKALPMNGDYLFWDGTGSLHTRTQRSRREVMRVLDRAGVSGHPHMFRDTFAVELLKNGEDIRTVQLLLGHASVVTTERSYAPWVKSFQQRLDDAIGRLTYGHSPSAPDASPRPLRRVS